MMRKEQIFVPFFGWSKQKQRRPGKGKFSHFGGKKVELLRIENKQAKKPKKQ